MVKTTQKSKDIQREFLIKYSIKHNYSFNRTQKLLKQKQVGIRRQVLLTKLRAEKQIKLYRLGWTIKNIPLHSSSQKPIYYGFLMQGFNIDLEYLRSKASGLKSKMMQLMVKHLINQNYVDDLKGFISFESPTEIVKNVR